MSAGDDPLLTSLLEMGFPRKKAQKALHSTGGNSVENAMEWIISNPDDEAEDFDPAAAAPSIKLALTDEERAEQAKKLEERLKQRRAEIEEEERKREIEREKSRRLTGREIQDAREKAMQAEMQQIAEERRREKEEDRKAKQRIKDLIAEDRQRKLDEQAKAKGLAPQNPAPTPAVVPIAQLAPVENKDYTQTRIQVRMLDGSVLTHTFGVNEPLSAVRLHAQMKSGISDHFGLMTNFPKKDFSEDEMQAPLSALGLVPSGTLIATKRVAA